MNNNPHPKPSDYPSDEIEWAGASTLLPKYRDNPHGLNADGWHLVGGAFWRVKSKV